MKKEMYRLTAVVVVSVEIRNTRKNHTNTIDQTICPVKKKPALLAGFNDLNHTQ